jgi:prepilin-type N-terminal cleavage/methylation domain-containing protein
MRTSCVPPSRYKGFSLIEVAVAVALLSIATAFSLPRVNRLASHAPVVALDAPHNDAQIAYRQHLAAGAEVPSGAVKLKLINLIRGYPANGTGSVLSEWGGFATTAEPNFHALTKADAPSGEKYSPSGVAPQSAKSAAARTNFETNGW